MPAAYFGNEMRLQDLSNFYFPVKAAINFS